MGCTYDVINAKLKSMNDIKKFINFFTEFFKDDFYYQGFEVDENDIKKDDNSDFYWIYIEDEPLFKMMLGEDYIELLVENFAKKYPKIPFQLSYNCTYNNCSDALYIEVNYEGENIIKLKKFWADDEGLFMCPKCEEDFDEPLCYIDDFEEGKTYICPYCGANIEYEVGIEESEIDILKG